MFSAILIILSMIFIDVNKTRGIQYKPLSRVFFFLFCIVFIFLMILGAKHVESPFIELGQIFTLLYFIYFLMFIPIMSYLDDLFY